MWMQQSDSLSSADKCCMDSATGDSGFLSSCNSIGYSSEISSNSIPEDTQLVSIDSIKDYTDSGIVDFGLSDSFDQLSLKQVSLNKLNSAEAHLQSITESRAISIDCERVSASAQKQQEVYQEPWRIYFTQNEDGDTLLHTAIIQGYFEATLSLINMASHPCLFDILNDDVQTALHLAVITNQPKVVRKLVVAGADLSIRNYQGNTALHLACMSSNLDCVKALTEPITTVDKDSLSGKLPTVPQNLEQLNYNGETCLHIAASQGHVEIVRLLVQLGADLEAQESLGGRTALHLALEHGQLPAVLYLAHECQSHLDAATYSGYTAYQLASCVDEQLARELVRLGATPMTLVDDEEDEYSSNNGFSVFGRGVAAAQASA